MILSHPPPMHSLFLSSWLGPISYWKVTTQPSQVNKVQQLQQPNHVGRILSSHVYILI